MSVRVAEVPAAVVAACMSARVAAVVEVVDPLVAALVIING
jgi:hypothetical protein